MDEQTIKTGFTLQPGLRVYAIGDVHGCLQELKAMHNLITRDLIESRPERVHLVYLGDYIDRGPDSKGVIDYLIERKNRGDGIEKTFLLGNHEEGMIDFLNDPESPNGSIWMDWGGKETAQSYGIELPEGPVLPAEVERISHDLRKCLPPSHWDFLNDLIWAKTIDDYFFAHAGVDPIKPFEKQSKSDLNFMREPFLSWPEPLAKMVVHGHTKTKVPDVKLHRIGVDTGCYESGVLTAAVLESDCVRFLQTESCA